MACLRASLAHSALASCSFVMGSLQLLANGRGCIPNFIDSLAKFFLRDAERTCPTFCFVRRMQINLRTLELLFVRLSMFNKPRLERYVPNQELIARFVLSAIRRYITWHLAACGDVRLNLSGQVAAAWHNQPLVLVLVSKRLLTGRQRFRNLWTTWFLGHQLI